MRDDDLSEILRQHVANLDAGMPTIKACERLERALRERLNIQAARYNTMRRDCEIFDLKQNGERTATIAQRFGLSERGVRHVLEKFAA
jgi:DNA-binding NarL/FixJ family response regulator